MEAQQMLVSMQKVGSYVSPCRQELQSPAQHFFLDTCVLFLSTQKDFEL